MDKLAFEVNDRDGVPIRLTQDRWISQIADRHPEVEPYIEEIKRVVQSPTQITEDEGGAYHLASFGIVPKEWRNSYLEVVVRYSPPEGEVLAVHFTDRAPKGDLKWMSK